MKHRSKLVLTAIIIGISATTCKNKHDVNPLTPGLYTTWMSQNKEAFSTLTPDQLILLGSHDAASYAIRVGSPPCQGFRYPSTGQPETSPADSAGIKKSKTQLVNLYQQLESGVRFLDLTVALQDNCYWSEHIWLSDQYFSNTGIVYQLKQYLQSYPDEIIFLNFVTLLNASGKMTVAEQHTFFELFHNSLGTLVTPRGRFDTSELGNIWLSPGRLIVIGDTQADLASNPSIWDSSRIVSVWANTKSIDTLMQNLYHSIVSWAGGADSNKLRILQAMTSTDDKIPNARLTNSALRDSLTNPWKNDSIYVIQVDDAVNSGLMEVIDSRMK